MTDHICHDQCWICLTFFKTTHEGELRSRGKISNIEFRFLVGKKWTIEERFSDLLFTFQPSQNVTRIVLRLWLTRDRVKCGLKATKGFNWDHKFWCQMWSASKLAPEVQYKLHFTEIHCLCFFCSVWLQLLEYETLSVKKVKFTFPEIHCSGKAGSSQVVKRFMTTPQSLVRSHTYCIIA